MQAVRLHPAASSCQSYSPSNPAPPSALHFDQDVPIPEPSEPGELLVRVKAASVIRDALTWPETYHTEYTILGNDVAGTVEAIFPDPSGRESRFKVGDEIFGMANTNRGSTWAQYTIMKEDEVVLKPPNLTWEQAAAMPLSALTAYEALVVHAGIPESPFPSPLGRRPSRRVLVTGGSGGVGVYLVQLARLAGEEVTAATSSVERNGELLRRLGVDQVIEYGDLKSSLVKYDVVIDTVGGNVLASCWPVIIDSGIFISVDSMSSQFVADHKKRGLSEGKDGVKALFFIVSGSRTALETIARLAQLGLLVPLVAETFSFAKASQAYERASGRLPMHGKVVLVD